MQEFRVGQRWINDAELQLGLGTVLDVEQRRVTLLFEAVDQKRTYAGQTAPLTRITFYEGDTVQTRDGVDIRVESIREEGGTLTYCGRDDGGAYHEIEEALLHYRVQLSRPLERLLSGRIDREKWFDLRYRTLCEMHRIGRSDLHGLTGCRIDLIPHQLYIAHEVARRVEAKKAKEQAFRAALQKERCWLEPALETVAAFGNSAEMLLRASLLVAGYHCHARSQWRRRRCPKKHS